MQSFFPMSRGDLTFIVALLVFAIVAFLPWARSAQWFGMPMQGWMMALLMVLAPTIALTRLMIERRGAATSDQEPRS
jgi:hypothetical protein